MRIFHSELHAIFQNVLTTIFGWQRIVLTWSSLAFPVLKYPNDVSLWFQWRPRVWWAHHEQSWCRQPVIFDLSFYLNKVFHNLQSPNQPICKKFRVIKWSACSPFIWMIPVWIILKCTNFRVKVVWIGWKIKEVHFFKNTQTFYHSWFGAKCMVSSFQAF